MALTATDNGGGGDFKPAPEGTHIARCVRIIDLGTQPGSQQYPTPRHKVLFVWELPGELEDVDGKKVPMLVMKRYTMSLHENAAMRHDLKAWRGREFTDAELKAFSLKNVVGAPCMVTVVHSSDGRYANLQAVTACPKGLDVPKPHHPLVFWEIENGADETFATFGDRLQETIRKAPEWAGPSDPDMRHDDDPGFGDDDIPF